MPRDWQVRKGITILAGVIDPSAEGGSVPFIMGAGKNTCRTQEIYQSVSWYSMPVTANKHVRQSWPEKDMIIEGSEFRDLGIGSHH